MVAGCAGTMVMMVDAISHTGVTHWLSLPPTARLEEEEEREREGGRRGVWSAHGPEHPREWKDQSIKSWLLLMRVKRVAPA